MPDPDPHCICSALLLKMQSKQKASLAGLLEITLTPFVSCGAGPWVPWQEEGNLLRLSCVWVLLGRDCGYPTVSIPRAGWSWLLPQQGSGQQQQPKLCVRVTQPFSVKTLTGLACYSSYFFLCLKLISSFNSNSALADL